MDVITLLVVVAVVGVIVWALLQLPMPAPFRTAIIVLAVLLLGLWVLQVLGVAGPVLRMR
jgi:hypothetical protein